MDSGIEHLLKLSAYSMFYILQLSFFDTWQGLLIKGKMINDHNHEAAADITSWLHACNFVYNVYLKHVLKSR